MDQSLNDDIVGMKRAIVDLQQRVSQLEGVRVQAPTAQPPRVQPPPFQHRQQRQQPTPPAPKPDAEYEIGAKWMPRVGASVFILGILYLVAMALQRGWITMQLQFIGELLVATSFVAIGLWKRNEREDYGQLLVGIGSCCLYLSFTGAHLFKNLIDGSTLVVLTAALSQANLLFSFWRSSKAFLGIGLLGGLAAAALPYRESNVPLATALHMLILLPALAIVVKNKWQDMWLLGSLSSMTLSLSSLAVKAPVNDQVLILWLPVIACTFAAALIPKGELSFTQAVWGFIPVAAIAGFSLIQTVLPLAAAVAAIALVFRAKEISKHLGMIALMLILSIEPWRFEPILAGTIFMATSIGLAVWAGQTKRDIFVAAGSLQLMLAMAAYGMFWRSVPVQVEMLWLFGAVVTLICTASAIAQCLGGEKNREGFEAVLSIFGFLIMAPVLRLCYLATPMTRFEADAPVAFLIASTIAVAAGTALTMLKGWRPPVVFAAIWLGLSIPAYLTLPWRESWAVDTMLLAGYAAATWLVLKASSVLDLQKGARTIGAFLMGFFIMHMLGIALLHESPIGIAAGASISVAWTTYAVGLLALGFAIDRSLLRWLALGVFAVSLGKVFLIDLAFLDEFVRILVLLALGLAMVATGYWYVRSQRRVEKKMNEGVPGAV